MARLGIHTHIVSETELDKNFVSISFEDDNGNTSFYGLHPTDSEFIPPAEQQHGYRYGGSDLRKDLDKDRPASYSHYADISGDAAEDFRDWLIDLRHEYHPQDNNNLQWAMNAWEHTTGQTIDATEIRHNSSGAIEFLQTPHGLEDFLRARDNAPARTAIELTPAQEKQKAELQADAATSRATMRSILWYEPEEIARAVSALHIEGNERLDETDPHERRATIEEIEGALEDAVTQGKAEKRWSTRDEPYYQLFDQDGNDDGLAIVPQRRTEMSPAEQERSRVGLKMPLRDARRSFKVPYKSGEYRPPSAAKNEPQKSGRSEYQPGSHKAKDAPRARDERDRDDDR